MLLLAAAALLAVPVASGQTLGSVEYPAFLVLVMRLMQANQALATPDLPNAVNYSVLEDPSVLAISSFLKPGETPEQAMERLQETLTETADGPPQPMEAMMVTQCASMWFDSSQLPDMALAQNPYGVALSIARCQQLQIRGPVLRARLSNVTAQSLQAVARKVLSPGNRAAVVIQPEQ